MVNKVECLACEEIAATEEVSLPFTGVFRGEVISYMAQGYKCSSCGFQWSTGEQQFSHDVNKFAQWMKKMGRTEPLVQFNMEGGAPMKAPEGTFFKLVFRGNDDDQSSES